MLARRLFVIWAACAVLVSMSTVFGNASCASFPDGECRGDRTNVLVSNEAGPDPDPCTRCLQEKCCEPVGACLEGDASCADEVKDAQACVMLRSQSAEPECKAALVSPASRQLYQCMRSGCGGDCRVPTCDLDPAVTLIVTPECDRCIGGACCEQIQSCYGNRQCKLFLECITTKCPNTFASSIQGAARTPPGFLEDTLETVCKTDSPPPLEARASPCFQRCLDEFAPLGANSNPDDRVARCRAFDLFTCSARKGCGDKCELDVRRELGVYEEDLDAGPSP
ncbi:MAG: hypothetical protein KIT84_44820 [Labilithrix sp.]|nr:hypothetical protein [Labilithrix sp.]MCW5818205.1 hypothetical protein [Labilithrix sp.]